MSDTPKELSQEFTKALAAASGSSHQKVNIRTDGKWKNFVYRYDVPKNILNGEFDWVDEETDDGFFKHKGTWYHLQQFMRLDDSTNFKGWDGILNESFSSGVIIKVNKNGERYKVGSYYVSS